MKNASRNDPCEPVACALTSKNISPVGLRRARLKCIDKYESEGLTKAAPFEALMTAVQAGLCRDALDAAETAKQALLCCTEVKDVLDLAINRYLDITRRIARNAHLEVRTRTGRKYVAGTANVTDMAATPDDKVVDEKFIAADLLPTSKEHP
jgi:hypothetical protein